jgi:hypothetical protein
MPFRIDRQSLAVHDSTVQHYAFHKEDEDGDSGMWLTDTLHLVRTSCCFITFALLDQTNSSASSFPLRVKE